MIQVDRVDKHQPGSMVTTPQLKSSQPRSNSRSSRGHLSWVHGSPRSQHNKAMKGACSPSSGANSPQFLHVPLNGFQDPYCTPKHKEAFQADNSSSNAYMRMHGKNLQAPRKGNNVLLSDDGSCSSRKAGNKDDSMSIREFRLETSSSEGEMSTDNSSAKASGGHMAALEEVRSQWASFTNSIMGVQVQPNELSVNPRSI